LSVVFLFFGEGKLLLCQLLGYNVLVVKEGYLRKVRSFEESLFRFAVVDAEPLLLE